MCLKEKEKQEHQKNNKSGEKKEVRDFCMTTIVRDFPNRCEEKREERKFSYSG